jgi:SAM-dependent methyltransferase
MNIFVAPTADEMGKFTGIVNAFPAIWSGSVLDVGCRSGNFQRAIPGPSVRYTGLDLCPPAAVIGNTEQGLPFHDCTFDVVVALDVLEHTDNIHRSFDELCRVACKCVVITLPNQYQAADRIRVLQGHHPCGKYGLPVEPPSDRHRWWFSFREAQTFTRERGQRHGFHVLADGCLVGPQRGSNIGRLLVGRFPDLLSPWYVAALQKAG